MKRRSPETPPSTGLDNISYWFDAYRCSTAFDLLGWTAHLLGKKWLEDTDWDEFIYRVLRANGWRDC